jgi:hypothetical protein
VDIRDVKIRAEDRMQYVAGIYVQYRTTSGGTDYYRNQCMIGKVTTRGDLEDASYLVNSQTWEYSTCYALALVPEVNNVVAVGEIYNGWRASALIVYTKSDLTSILTKTWSYTGDYQSGWSSSFTFKAYDVTVAEGDGSIYVTGIL